MWAIDRKRMELSFERALFARYADAADEAVELLEAAVAAMQERAERHAGRQRVHVSSVRDPFAVVVLDEVDWRMRDFNNARKDAGLDGIGLTPHKLRHTAASLAIAAGADVKVVQQMLGHTTATMTLDTYGHLFPDRLDEVADAVDAGRMKAAAARAEHGGAAARVQ
ncbi:tyrosine-type recombinase/integrase [Streptomonospora wellingtoniae]|uniref:Tyrosine-type recombinase/integrase n=1 Tax=Streptomonospora wellingtoniae TaxID=3075544 RepID=A0ABU2KXQ8_9ACTN|nr:tyrosine-type recombinase/integrase [Streptomonospora sp. DSM 45055]MDT0304001.1 tyrosine-type recombinase/integrase [Streptomonospora sp. DSM 45055]